MFNKFILNATYSDKQHYIMSRHSAQHLVVLAFHLYYFELSLHKCMQFKL